MIIPRKQEPETTLFENAMVRCPHCDALNSPSTNFCVACGLDIHMQRQKRSTFPSVRTVVIILIVVAALAFLIWLLAALGASGLSDG